MVATQIMVPCIEFSSQCRVDWSAISAVGGWLSAIATFLAVYVPARNYRIDNKKRAERERRVSIVEINRAIPKILDIQGQARTVRESVIPHIPTAITRGKSSALQLADLLRIKGGVPFVIFSDGLELISIGMSNLQTALDGLNNFLNTAAEIELYENHPLHRLQDFEAGLRNIEKSADNVLMAIKKLTNMELVLDQSRGADTKQ